MLKHNRHNRWVHTHTCPHCGHVVRSSGLRTEHIQTNRITCPRCGKPSRLNLRLRRAGNIGE